MFRSKMKIRVALIMLVLVLLGSVSAFAEYDQAKVVAVMRGNLGYIGEISSAAAAEEWVLAAQNLFAISEGMLGIMVYDPPRGTKADWDATLMEFVKTAYLGIGACGAQDVEALQEVIAKLKGLNRQGHGDHK